MYDKTKITQYSARLRISHLFKIKTQWSTWLPLQDLTHQLKLCSSVQIQSNRWEGTKKNKDAAKD